MREKSAKLMTTVVENPMPPQPKPLESKPQNASSGGSVLVDKVNEPLDALLQAYEARLKKNQTMEQRWMTYPYADLEKGRMEMCSRMIETTQALLAPPKPRTASRKDCHATSPGKDDT